MKRIAILLVALLSVWSAAFAQAVGQCEYQPALSKPMHRPDTVLVTFKDYKMLKQRYPNKLFIYISHIDGKEPEGRVAKRIWRDANVVLRVEGYRAFPTSRYESKGTPIDISTELANQYWGLEQ